MESVKNVARRTRTAGFPTEKAEVQRLRQLRLFSNGLLDVWDDHGARPLGIPIRM